MKELFLELVRVSIGTQTVLSRIPSADEWSELYNYAKYQALVGFCFDGINHLTTEQMPPRNIFLQWMALSDVIKKKNGILNDHCAELCEMLQGDGFKPVILKGQGNSLMYPNPLARQCGDIDVWLDKDKQTIIDYVNAKNPIQHHCFPEHIDFHWFTDVEVEVHYALGMANTCLNRKRLSNWFQKMRAIDYPSAILPNGKKIVVPNLLLNLVHQLAHIEHHFAQVGIGLKQILDYYYLLVEAGRQNYDFSEYQKVVKHIRLNKMARALMYVLQKTFGISAELLPLKPNKFHGQFLYDEILLSGNFGKRDERRKQFSNLPKIRRLFKNMFFQMRYIPHFPIIFLQYFYGAVRTKLKNLFSK